MSTKFVNVHEAKSSLSRLTDIREGREPRRGGYKIDPTDPKNW